MKSETEFYSPVPSPPSLTPKPQPPNPLPTPHKKGLRKIETKKTVFDRKFSYAQGLLVLTGLYLSSLYNYLLFHSLAEIFSILVAGSMFMIAWNSKKYIKNSYLIFIAIAYLFIGFLDLLHMLSYKGMNIFRGDVYYANQLWIGARGLESLTLLIAFLFLRREKKVWPEMLFAVYAVISALIIASVFWWKIFPVCFVEGKGQTDFKIISEYVICTILVIDILLLFQHRDRFEEKVFRYLVWSLFFTIGSELAFTFYISNYGFSNLLGHYFKIFSFYLIYKAIIETGIVRPYDIIFRELRIKEQNLEEARKAADAANRAKSEFLANMSHELRTPLNGILGYAQILRRDRELRESQKNGLDVIERSGTHLLNLINEILDLSKIEARKLELHPAQFRFPEFLHGIAQIVQIRAGEKGISFHSEIASNLPPAVRADEKRIAQVLLNLLSNAVKFTDKGGVVFLVMKTDIRDLPPEKQENDSRVSIRFQIEDTGAGIPEDKLEDIFSPFRQVGDHTRNIEGTGLGLTISRRLVRLMGGELNVKSTEGKGSTFWFDLMLEKAQTVTEIRKADADQIVGYKGEKRRVLIVDDRWENRAVLSSFLTSLGFDLAEAGDGREALLLAGEFRPEMIFMDLVMPGMDGFEATRQIRNSPDLNHIRVVAVSASFSLSPEEIIAGSGLDGYIAKPVQFEEIFKALEKYLHVEWTYREEKEPLTAEAPECRDMANSGQMKIPPLAEIREIRSLSRLGDISGIRDILDKVAQADPCHSLFVSEIRQLLGRFQVNEIQDRMEEILGMVQGEEDGEYGTE
ncbi:MAG: MASE3 domain-containing protein [Desulfococcaceae bacterium]